jgi:NAD(P)H-hydrate epimerase
MHSLPLEIYSVESVRAIDRRAIATSGISGYTLMTRAGEFAAREILRSFPRSRRWQIVCGPGNNGGDGYVVARAARESAVPVSVISVCDPDTLSGDASRACRDWVESGGAVTRWRGTLDEGADLSVDALFGSGLSRPLDGEYAAIVDALNKHAAPVVALDVPSGIHGDTGASLGPAVRAALTITFVGLKSGLFLGEGYAAAGEVRYAGLDVPDTCRAPERPVLRRIDRQILQSNLPARARNAHKGDFGHVLVIGGGPGMPGAARLCGEAALRSGAGKVSVATHPSHAAVLGAARPELMVFGVKDADELAGYLATADVVALGPGLGRSSWARALYEAVAELAKPAVWDADALNLLAASGAPRSAAAPARIITPHPGEAGRLLGRNAADIQLARLPAVRELAERYDGTVVLKGAGTLIAARDSVPRICTAGNPGMAAPGMGDVLSGIIAALLAQGLASETAAVAGVEAHARAGDLAAVRGTRGLLASDLFAELSQVLNPARDTPQ